MSVKESRNWLPNQRVDVPDLKALDSSVIYDFAALLKCFQDGTPYILRGFEIPFTAIKTNLHVIVADSILWAPNQSSGSFLKVDAGAANEYLNTANTKVIGALADGALNYVGLRLTRSADSSTKDTVIQYDKDSKEEFAVTVPRGLVLTYEIVISQTDFGTTCPIAIININGSSQVTEIQNCKNGMFRLGKGGATPDINYSHPAMTAENNLSATTNGDQNFSGGDWEIHNFKEWLDAVMTRFKALFGSQFWYTSSNISNLNLLDLFSDTAATVMTSRGKFQQGGAGALTWTDDILLRSIASPRTYSIPADTANLSDKQVAYITIERNIDFQPTNSFTFNSTTNTAVGLLTVSGISVGDWIKAVGDNEQAWRKVKQISGNTITFYGPLDAYPDDLPNYPTDWANVKALKCTGSYTMQVADPQDVPADSNTYWLAKRDDNTFNTLTVSNVERTANIATITTSGNHGLVPGQMVRLSGIGTDAYFNGDVEILATPAANTFTCINNGPDVASVAAAGSVDFVAIIYLRGIGELNEGESIAIDNQVPENILEYIGAMIDSQSSPIYGGVTSGSLDLPNYNSTAGENLTARLSKVTAMLADIRQDLNIEVDMGSVTWVSNQVSITGASLSIPGTTVGAAAVAINTVTNQALSDGECLYVDINRSAGGALSVSSPTALSSLTPSQQRLVLVRRIGSNIMVRG